MTTKIRTWIIGAAALGAAAAFAPAAWAGCGVSMVKQPAAYSTTSAPIVGMWSFSMYSGGALADFGYIQWHSDGTEIMNSGGRAPASENFCLGVWGQLGAHHYQVNHFALAYDPSSGKLVAKINIKETVYLDSSGNNYTGDYVLDVYDPQTGRKLQEQKGTIVAERITL